MDIRVGLYNEHIKMDRREISEEKFEEVRGSRTSKFNIYAGPLVINDHILNETYVLEIDYRQSEKSTRGELGMDSFGSHLFHDYAEKANNLAQKFCEEQGFEIHRHINSWPQFQAIVVKQEQKEAAA